MNKNRIEKPTVWNKNKTRIRLIASRKNRKDQFCNSTIVQKGPFRVNGWCGWVFRQRDGLSENLRSQLETSKVLKAN